MEQKRCRDLAQVKPFVVYDHSLRHKLKRRYKYLKGRRRGVVIGSKQMTHQGVASVWLCAKSSHSEYVWSKRMWSNTCVCEAWFTTTRVSRSDRGETRLLRYTDISHRRSADTTSSVPRQHPRFTSIYVRLWISAALIHSANTLIAHPPSRTHPEWTEPSWPSITSTMADTSFTLNPVLSEAYTWCDRYFSDCTGTSTTSTHGTKLQLCRSTHPTKVSNWNDTRPTRRTSERINPLNTTQSLFYFNWDPPRKRTHEGRV